MKAYLSLERNISDLDLLQIVKAYLLDIGVDMEIRVMDSVAWTAFINAHNQDQMCVSVASGQSCGLTFPPSRVLTRRYSKHVSNYTFNNDAAFDKMYEDLIASATVEEMRLITVEANDYAIAQHWSINILPTVVFAVYEPWYKGYSGELSDRGGFYDSKCWIDQSLKTSMGH